jgi:DNA helicase-2/ATP-dependent DNA helicase PcrA
MDDQSALMKRVLKDLELDKSQWQPRAILSAISGAKNALQSPEEFQAQSSDYYANTVAQIYIAYERALRAANAVDFDDLLLLTVDLLRRNETARSEVQDRWRYLMIDEYQDTNQAQFILSSLVCGSSPGVQPNVCVVGDPDQSIYGWRGADISNILDFETTYHGAHVIALGQNFRSSAPILAAADTLIRNNTKRKHKDLFTTREGGSLPTIVLCQDEHHEAKLVVDWMRALHAQAIPDDDPNAEALTWKDMAIFYRNNALSRVLEDECRGAGIPYVIARGTAFYQREEVKDAIAYLRIVANGADDVSLRRIINKPARKIGKTTIDRIDTLAAQHGIPLLQVLRAADQTPGVSPAACKAIAKFVEMIDSWNAGGTFMGSDIPASLADLVSRVISESKLEDYYIALSKKREEDAQKLDNLRELVSSARDFELNFDPTNDPALTDVPADPTQPIQEANTPPLLSMCRAYLESIALVADADAIDPASGALTLMTLHAAKGLEFPAVAMVGLEEGLLPAQRALASEDELEEERRLCFVGITRAMHHLTMTSARYRTHRGLRERTIPSRFISELPEGGITLSDQTDAYDDTARDWGSDFDSSNTPASKFKTGNPKPTPKLPGELSYEQDEPEIHNLAAGATVRHPQFGVGVVASISSKGMNARATIEFQDAGRKTLVLQYARLEIIE